MAQMLYEDEEFKILKTKDYIVVRKRKPYSFHSHFHKYSGAKSLIDLFYKKLQPEDEYFNVAMQRITEPKEFQNFTIQKRKQRYYNVNKGIKNKGRRG
ncbi:hypothetical protein LAV60_15560 [Clostridium sporogenes]|uniref:hypothetical protein n=1 Tax=Clostridium sporogenes TaxID=1509 RepID=UPI00223788B2|nr:hypothetical protein [Clostridium sporogenes]MCW6094588.1 hypothetical protein [Clostridium sporogenes]